MQSIGSDWYQKIWSLDIMDQSWVENTKQQVDFLVDQLELKGGERILDLACGFGRHSIELAARGFSIIGVDITKEYIKFASETARQKQLNADYLYGQTLNKPNIEQGNPTRLYNLSEIEKIMCERGLALRDSFADFTGAKASADSIQLMVYSQKYR